MKRSISIFLVITFVLAACTSAPQVTVTSEVTVTSIPTPTETSIPTPTTDLLMNILEKAGISVPEMKNAVQTEDGVHVTLTDGSEEVITNEMLAEQAKIREQDGTLQIFDEQGRDVIWAYDNETKEWLRAADWVYYPENKQVKEELIPRIKLDQLEERLRRGRLFFEGYPDNLFVPDPEQINYQYGSVFADQYPEGKYPPQHPFGPGMVGVLKPYNMFLVEADPENGQKYDTVYIDEGVGFGVNDTFDFMNFALDMINEKAIGVIQDWVSAAYLLPPTGATENYFDNGESIITFSTAAGELNVVVDRRNGNVYFDFAERLAKSLEEGELDPALKIPLFAVKR